jgi:hypothetical protein
MSKLSDLAALASLSKEAQASQVAPGYILGEHLVVSNLGYWSEMPSKKGSGIVPSKFYGTIEGAGMARLQNEDADLWYAGLKEAMVELGYKDAVLWLEGEMVETRLKGAIWSFEVEAAFVGKEVEHVTWDDGDAFKLHGGMLAGPVNIRVREHKPPRKATHKVIKLGVDE